MRTFLEVLLVVVSSLWSLTTTRAQVPLPQWSKAFGSRLYSNQPTNVAHIRHGRILAASAVYVGTGATRTTQTVLWIIGPRGDSIRFLSLPKLPLHSTEGFGAIELPNGDFLVSGRGYDPSVYRTVPDCYLTTSYHTLTRLDSLGNVRWQRQFNDGIAWASGQAPPLLLPDGGALVLLSINPIPGTSNLPADRPMLLRVDSTGTVLWQRVYGNYQNSFAEMRPLADGSYALAGGAYRPVPGQTYVIPDGWVQRIKLNGDTLRSRYIGQMNDYEGFVSMRPTANGGMLLGGVHVPSYYQQPTQTQRGWLVQVDSLDRVQWQYDFQSAPGAVLAKVSAAELLQGGDILLNGNYNPAGANLTGSRYDRYLARWHPGPTGAPFTTVWERWNNDYSIGGSVPDVQSLSADGRFTTGGYAYSSSGSPIAGLTHYANVGLPYVPDYCARPPQAQLGYARPTPDSLVLLDFSQPGPRYAQVLVWRWTLGDGSVVVRHDNSLVRHRYASVPAPGTPVTLTVTNNLGCTHTTTEYPWGPLSTAQQVQALAAGATLAPNPATDHATLVVPYWPGTGPVPVQVLDALGRSVRQGVVQPGGGSLGVVFNLVGLPSGVYAVRVLTDEGMIVKRLVKQE